MFEIAIIFLSRVLLILAGFWLYRMLRTWKGFQHPVIGRKGAVMNPTHNGQKGYVSLSQKQLNGVSGKSGKAPWGW